MAVLRLPPLRERREDLGVFIDHLLDQVNREGTEQPGCVDKKLSAGARDLLLSQPWPGNVRELQNTLRRAAIWSAETRLSAEDIRDALLPARAARARDGVLERPLGEDLDLPEILASVARHYLERALDEARGNKTLAAGLVGLPSYQTFINHQLDEALRRGGMMARALFPTPFSCSERTPVAENEFNLAASRYKPRVGEKAPDEDPAGLIRDVLEIEREIQAGLEKLLREIEA